SIPNPVAKIDCADGTALGRVWESRSPPDIFVWGVGETLKDPWGPFASPAPPFFISRTGTPTARRQRGHLAPRCAPRRRMVGSPAVRISGVAPITARPARRGRGWRRKVDSGAGRGAPAPARAVFPPSTAPGVLPRWGR